MTTKEKFINWIEKKDRQQREQDAARAHLLRNRKYHEYFKGYTEYIETKPNGKTKIRRVYTGVYHRVALNNWLYALLRGGYVVLWFVLAVCQISATFADFGYNYTWYATVPQAFGFPVSFCLMVWTISAALADRNLKLKDYKTYHQTLPRAALAAAVIHALSALSMGLYLILNHPVPEGALLPPLKMLIAAACALGIGLMERSMAYERIENPVKPEPGGIEIE